MEYLTLNNGVQMPLVGFGTFMLSGETCTKSVAAAIESGYRMIDTAEASGNEKEVGAGIKASGMDRKELFLVTKVNFKSYENAELTVLQSLENLQTDYIDLLLLHWPFANYYAAWRSLEKLYTEGKVRAIGVSNFEPDQLSGSDRLQQGRPGRQPDQDEPLLPAHRRARLDGQKPGGAHGLRPAWSRKPQRNVQRARCARPC